MSTENAYENIRSALQEVFDFIRIDDNRRYNHELQEKVYVADVAPYSNPGDKILSILYRIINTQSQPDLDSIGLFFQNLYNNKDCLDSMCEYLDYLDIKKYKKKRIQSKKSAKVTQKSEIMPYEKLFFGMCDQPGWGEKTAALFVKTIYHHHNGKYGENYNLKIWTDAPDILRAKDSLWLPVDAVILEIFRYITKGLPKKSNKNKVVAWNFFNINNLLHEIYTDPNDIEIWDDLWFWGYISQKIVEVDKNGSEMSAQESKLRIINNRNIEKEHKIPKITKRNFSFNKNKYWAIKTAPKDTTVTNEIEKKTKIFIKKLNNAKKLLK